MALNNEIKIILVIYVAASTPERDLRLSLIKVELARRSYAYFFFQSAVDFY